MFNQISQLISLSSKLFSSHWKHIILVTLEKDLKLHYLSFVSINNFGFKNILSKLSNFYEMPANTFDK